MKSLETAVGAQSSNIKSGNSEESKKTHKRTAGKGREERMPRSLQELAGQKRASENVRERQAAIKIVSVSNSCRGDGARVVCCVFGEPGSIVPDCGSAREAPSWRVRKIS